MDKWWTQFKLENRFIYRNWFFLLAPFAFGAFISLIFAIESSGITSPRLVDPTEQYLSMMNSYQTVIHTLTLGIMMLLAVLSIRRHYNPSAYAVTGSWPVSQTTIISAKYIAGFLYASIFTAMMAIVFWLLAVWLGVNMQAAADACRFYVLQYERSYGVTLALGMFLAAVIPGRIAYLISFCGWMFGTFFLDRFIIVAFHLYYLKTFHLSRFLTAGIWPSLVNDSVWGLDIIRRELWLSRLFVFAFAAALVAAIVFILKKRRPTRSLKRWTAITTAVIVLTAASAAPYFMMWGKRYSIYHAHAADSVPYTVVHPEGAVDDDLQAQKAKQYPTYKFPVSEYAIKAKQTADEKLAVKAQLTVPATVLKQHNPLTFTLNRRFTIQNLSVNGRAVEFNRKDDYVTIGEWPDHASELTFQFQYEGTVEEWGYTYGEKYYAFLNDNSLFIPSYIAWYPLPGKQPLYVYEGLDRDTGQVHLNSTAGLTEKGADFTVTLLGFDHPVFATIQPKQRTDGSQTFKAEDAIGVSLVAGNLSKVTDPDSGVVLIGPARHEHEMKQVLDRTSDMVTYYRHWLDLPNETTKLFFLRLNIFLNNGWLRLDSSFISDSFEVNNIYLNRKGEVPSYNIGNTFKTALLYGSYRAHSPGDTGKKILEFIDEMYNVEKNGESFPKTSYKGMPKDFRNEHQDEITTVHKMTDMVNQAVNEGKIDQVKEILKYFYKKGLAGESGMKPQKITFQAWQRKWDQVMNR